MVKENSVHGCQSWNTGRYCSLMSITGKKSLRVKDQIRINDMEETGPEGVMHGDWPEVTRRLI